MASIPQEQYVEIQYAGQEIDPLASKLSVLERRFDAHIGKGGNVHASATRQEAGFMSPDDKQKLDGVENGATQNATDAFLLNRGNHQGQQPIESVTGLRQELDDALAGGSNYRGLFPSLVALEEAIPVAVAGNYADVDEGEGIDAIRYIWDDSDQSWVSGGTGEPLTAPQVKALYESNPNTNPLTDSRAQLIDGLPSTSASLGATILGRGVVAVGSISELLIQPKRADLIYVVDSYYSDWALTAPFSQYGGGVFQWVPDSELSADGGLVFGGSGSPGRFMRIIKDGDPLSTDMFGPNKDGSSSAASAILAAKSAGERLGKKLVVNNGVYSMGGQPLIFDKPMEFVGESKGGVQFSWSNALTATSGAISVGKGADVVGCRIGGFRCIGGGTGRGLDTGASLAFNCKDSLFEDMRFENFAVGLRQTYSWCNTFKNIRFHNCAKPFELASQVNATHYDTLSFTTFTQLGTFSNCEGIHFTAPNISNFTGVIGGVGFSLFQSSVSMYQPYFENASPVLAQVGSNSESLVKSELLIKGGVGSGEIRYANGATVDIEGIRQVGGSPMRINTADLVSPVAVAGELTRLIGTGVDRPSRTPLFEVTAKRVPDLAGAFGGASFSYALMREYLAVTQSTANNGIMIASDLVVGAQYTLVVEVRRQAGIAIAANNGTALTLSDDAVPDSAQPWKQSRFVFVANAATLRWQFTGTIQVRSIKLYSGVVSDVPLEAIPTEWAGPAVPASGAWKRGDSVDNSLPAVGSPKGWKCTVTGSPGTWVSTGNL